MTMYGLEQSDIDEISQYGEDNTQAKLANIILRLQESMNEIQRIIEAVDERARVGKVPATPLRNMTHSELARINQLSKRDTI